MNAQSEQNTSKVISYLYTYFNTLIDILHIYMKEVELSNTNGFRGTL